MLPKENESTVSYFDHRHRLTARVRRSLVGLRQQTRAHLLIAQRPSARQKAEALVGTIQQALEAQLGTAVALTGRLVEAAVVPSTSLAMGSAFAVLELSQLGGRAVLEVEMGLLVALLERLSGGPGRPSPVTRLTRIEEAGFAYLVLLALQAGRAEEFWHQRVGPRLLSVHAQRSEAAAVLSDHQRHLALEVEVAVGEVSGVVRLLLPSQMVQRAVHELRAEPPREPAPEVLGAGLWFTSRLGWTELHPTELEALTPGDVVMFPVRVSEGRLLGPCRLLGPSFVLSGRLEPSGFHFSHALTSALTQESTVSSTQVTQLPVEVEIELTRLRLTVAELAAIKPGVVMPLHVTAQDTVLLRVGDKAVARAELVDIEGEVGARVIALLP